MSPQKEVRQDLLLITDGFAREIEIGDSTVTLAAAQNQLRAANAEVFSGEYQDAAKVGATCRVAHVSDAWGREVPAGNIFLVLSIVLYIIRP